MIPRETGSDTSRVEIKGGVHDGATGTIVQVLDEDDAQVVTVALDSGGTLELTLGHRETARAGASSLRTLGT